MRKRELKDEDYVKSISNVVDLLFKARRLEKKLNRAVEYIEPLITDKDDEKCYPICWYNKDVLLGILKNEKMDELKELTELDDLRNQVILLQARISKAVGYMNEAINSDSSIILPSGKTTDIGYCIPAFEDLLNILKGEGK